MDSSGRPLPGFLRPLNDAFSLIVRAINALASLTGQTAALEEALNQAQQAVVAAQTAADNAQAAADAAKTQAQAAAMEAALVNSYIDPTSVLTATTTQIAIADHTRHYADGTSVAVKGATIAATGQGDTDYVSYLDASRAGGIVPYQVSTIAPTQGMNVHVVGAVTIPATGTASGGKGPQKPGYVTPDD